jgi:hypothetical protein
VMGAIVRPVKKGMADCRVRIRTGQRLSGLLKVYQ